MSNQHVEENPERRRSSIDVLGPALKVTNVKQKRRSASATKFRAAYKTIVLAKRMTKPTRQRKVRLKVIVQVDP